MTGMCYSVGSATLQGSSSGPTATTHGVSYKNAPCGQQHFAGEKCFIDYFGPTVAVISQDTGECRQAQIFVAIQGASNYTFAEAT